MPAYHTCQPIDSLNTFLSENSADIAQISISVTDAPAPNTSEISILCRYPNLLTSQDSKGLNHSLHASIQIDKLDVDLPF